MVRVWRVFRGVGQKQPVWGVSLVAQTGLLFDLGSAQGKLIASLMAALAGRTATRIFRRAHSAGFRTKYDTQRVTAKTKTTPQIVSVRSRPANRMVTRTRTTWTGMWNRKRGIDMSPAVLIHGLPQKESIGPRFAKAVTTRSRTKGKTGPWTK